MLQFILDYISGDVRNSTKYIFQEQLVRKSTEETVASSDEESESTPLNKEFNSTMEVPHETYASINYRLTKNKIAYTFTLIGETEGAQNYIENVPLNYKDTQIRDLIIDDILKNELEKKVIKDQPETASVNSQEKDFIQHETIKKFFELLKVLNQLRNKENATLALYDVQNQIVMFFDSLSKSELESIIEIKKAYEKFFWGEWRTTDLVTMGIDVFFTFASLTAVSLGLPGLVTNPRLTFGFGNNIGEIAGSLLWNIPGTALFNIAQARQQVARAEHASMWLNTISAAGLITFSCMAIAEFLKGNVQAAADLTGWSFAASMFVSFTMDLRNYYHFQGVWMDAIKELEDSENIKNFINKDEFAQLNNKNNGDELTKISGIILAKLRDNNPGFYGECEQRLNMIIHGKDKAGRHLRLAKAWFVCFLGMSCLAGATTLAAAYSGGISLVATPIILPIFNATVAFLATAFRGWITVDALSDPKAKEAMQARDEWLENKRKSKEYSILRQESPPNEETMAKGVIVVYKENGIQKYAVKWNNNDIKSGVIMQKNSSYEMSDDEIKNFIASKRHIVRDEKDLVVPKRNSNGTNAMTSYTRSLFQNELPKKNNLLNTPNPRPHTAL